MNTLFQDLQRSYADFVFFQIHAFLASLMRRLALLWTFHYFILQNNQLDACHNHNVCMKNCNFNTSLVELLTNLNVLV